MTTAGTYVDGEGIGRRNLLKKGAIGGGLVVAALATPGLTGTAEAKGGKSLVLNVDTDGFADFQGNTPGGAFYVSGGIWRPGGLFDVDPTIGRFQCWGFIPNDNPGPQDAVVNQEFAIDGRGKIQISGLENASQRAVTGGTGDFANARGQGIPDVVTFDFFNTGKFRIDFRLTGATGPPIH